MLKWAIEGLTPVTENCELVIRFNHMILGSFLRSREVNFLLVHEYQHLQYQVETLQCHMRGRVELI